MARETTRQTKKEPAGKAGGATRSRKAKADSARLGGSGIPDAPDGLDAVAAVHALHEGEDADDQLTPRQEQVLEVIRAWVERFGYPPSVREIGEAVGLNSTSSVSHQLRALQRKGYLRRDANRPRAVGVLTAAVDPAAVTAAAEQLDQLPKPAYVPLVGRIAAGGPVLAEQAIEDVFPLPKDIVGEGDVFLLRVAGDSMVDAAITDGDWVVVRQQPTADNGEIVAAMIDGEATVKTFKRKDGHVWLMPQNEAYEPIAGDEASILGKVVAVLRRL
ncbi:repressor LexA [Amycolatopsis marina]|uniref:LexA repressor n=1 Tax=Amycolatopsis marina TaxID=490629 RepID=A0A1I1AIF1_9PSEU|nr:repressor LexA [Amycolatopsis marina]